MVVCSGNERASGGRTVGLRVPGRGGRMRKWAASEESVRVDWVGTNWAVGEGLVGYCAFWK